VSFGEDFTPSPIVLYAIAQRFGLKLSVVAQNMGQVINLIPENLAVDAPLRCIYRVDPAIVAKIQTTNLVERIHVQCPPWSSI
jgi:hypothetical protein